MRLADSSAFESRHNVRKTSTACRLSENLCSVLINATTSERCRRLAFSRGLKSRRVNINASTKGKKKHLLQILLIKFKKDLQSGTKAGRLDFPPESALVASYTVHNSTDISKVLLELFFQDLRGVRQLGPRDDLSMCQLTLAFSPLKRVVSSNLPATVAISRTFSNLLYVITSSSRVPEAQ